VDETARELKVVLTRRDEFSNEESDSFS